MDKIGRRKKRKISTTELKTSETFLDGNKATDKTDKVCNVTVIGEIDVAFEEARTVKCLKFCVFSTNSVCKPWYVGDNVGKSHWWIFHFREKVREPPLSTP